MIQGDNGAGKTSLLEALTYCSVLKSFRGVQRDSLLRQSASAALLACELLQGTRRVEIEVRIEATRRDQATLNKQRVSGAKELVEVLRTTLFTPDDLDLVKGSPAGRRDLLDDAILATSPRLAAERAALERILRQRNALLRQLNGRLPTDAVLTLDIWDERLAATGERVAEAREQLVASLTPYASAAWSTLAPASGKFELRYARSFAGPLADVIAAQRQEDLRRQVTTVGPQRDELKIIAGGLDARTRLSQGRQRCVALALRLGIHRYVTDVTGSVPVLLLDDAFSRARRPHRPRPRVRAPVGPSAPHDRRRPTTRGLAGPRGEDRERRDPPVNPPRRGLGTPRFDDDDDDPAVTPIGDAMATLLRSRGLGATVVLAEIMSAWERAAGPEISARVKPVALRHRELVCEVDDPAWATQVRLLSEQLLANLADEVGGNVADRLSVHVKRRSEG